MNYTQRRLKEFEETLLNKLAYIGDSGEKHKEKLKFFLSESIAQAIAEDRARVRGILEQRLLIKCECENGDCANCDRLTLVIDNLSDLSSIDKPIKNNI